jgi:hypothetical protein
MAITKAKQIEKPIQGFIGVLNSAILATNSSKVVTADITTAVGTLPLQLASSTQQGIVVSPYGNDKIEMWDTTTKEKLKDTNNNEIYGRLTEATGVYTLSFYSLVVGVETAYTFTVNTNIDYVFVYKYDFRYLPEDFAIKFPLISSNNDPERGGILVLETLTVTALNTINNLSFVPKNVNQVLFYVNRTVVTPLDGITVVGQAITVTPATLGYDIETTDTVYAYYQR